MRRARIAGSILVGFQLVATSMSFAGDWSFSPYLRTAGGYESALLLDPGGAALVVPGGAFFDLAPTITVQSDLSSKGFLQFGTRARWERFFNEVGLFLGYTFERGEGGATVGLDYVRWLVPERIGVGAFLDLVFGDVDARAVGAGVWVRPFREIEDLTFVVAPGIDLANEEEESELGLEGERGKAWEAAALLRLGVLYGFDLGRGYRFVPSFYVDIIFPDKAAYVMGVGIGKEF